MEFNYKNTIKYLTILEFDDDSVLTEKDIHIQYRKLCKIYHPDQSDSRYRDGKKFVLIKEAHDYLIENLEYVNRQISSNTNKDDMSSSTSNSNYATSEHGYSNDDYTAQTSNTDYGTNYSSYSNGEYYTSSDYQHTNYTYTDEKANDQNNCSDGENNSKDDTKKELSEEEIIKNRFSYLRLDFRELLRSFLFAVVLLPIAVGTMHIRIRYFPDGFFRLIFSILHLASGFFDVLLFGLVLIKMYEILDICFKALSLRIKKHTNRGNTNEIKNDGYFSYISFDLFFSLKLFIASIIFLPTGHFLSNFLINNYDSSFLTVIAVLLAYAVGLTGVITGIWFLVSLKDIIRDTIDYIKTR